MTNNKTLVAAGFACAALAVPALASSSAHAQNAASGSNLAVSGTWGLEAHYQDYREPSLDVEEEGWFGGFTAAGQLAWQRWQLRGDARLAYGRMDYTGSGRIDGISDFVFEGRAVLGFVIPVGDSAITQALPYAGYGYRMLYDDLGGHRSTTGAAGYDRISQYHYIPVGVELTLAGPGGWTFKPAAEYDYLVRGYQESRLSEAVAGLSDLNNTQESGYGLRASFMAATVWNGRPVEFGPFVRYWNIDDSDVQPVSFRGVTVGGGYEPANETVEAGVALKIGF